MTPPPPPAPQGSDEPAGWLTRRFQRLAQRPIASYLLHMYGEMAVLAIIALVIMGGLDLPTRTDLAEMDATRMLVFVLGVAPYLETLLFQALGCGVARKLGLGFWPQVLFAWIPFFLAHLSVSLSTAICAGGVIGFYLSVTYVSQRSFSWRRAFYSTWALHVINNLVAIAVVYAAGGPGA